MTMQKPFTKISKVVAALILTAGTSLTQAGVIINSINLEMVNSDHSALGNEDRDKQAAYNAANQAFESVGDRCSQSLDALMGITARNNCKLNDSDNGVRYTIKGSSSSDVEFQFGLDWGRGGFVSFEGESSNTLNQYASNTWWNLNWSNSQVIGLRLPAIGDFTLTLLGFENCCDGVNAARYRSPTDVGAQWQDLKVNAVPLPGSLSLMVLGGLLLLVRRARSAAYSL